MSKQLANHSLPTEVQSTPFCRTAKPDQPTTVNLSGPLALFIGADRMGVRRPERSPVLREADEKGTDGPWTTSGMLGERLQLFVGRSL